MKRQRIIALILALCLVFPMAVLSSCEKKGSDGREKFTEYSLDFFDTATSITGYTDTREEFDRICEELFELLGDYHRLFTIYHRYDGMENLCTVNELKDGEHRVVTVDGRIIDMLLYAREMYELTDGRVNVAMGSVLSIWHDYRTKGMDKPWEAELPPMDKLEAAALHTNIEDMIIDEENSTVWLRDPQMKLDVGAIAKGYAVEMAARYLEEQGIDGFVINVGGNVRTVGTKPSGEAWVAGIEDPDESAEDYLVYLKLSGESVVTSGSYQRYYVVGYKSYHHIIDPETLMPATGYLSVSVVCKDSGQGDGLSTALFCMSYEDGLALVESLRGVEALWVLPDGAQRTSSGFASFVTEYK